MTTTGPTMGATEARLAETKEVKVRLPVAHLIKLHGLKLLKGQNISDTVAAALHKYFDAVEAEEGPIA